MLLIKYITTFDIFIKWKIPEKKLNTMLSYGSIWG